MEKDLNYIFAGGILTNSQIKEKIYNDMKKNEKIIEEIEVENIPFCIECILEDNLGVYICGECKINLCPNHAEEHSTKFQNHKYSYLFISDYL